MRVALQLAREQKYPTYTRKVENQSNKRKRGLDKTKTFVYVSMVHTTLVHARVYHTLDEGKSFGTKLGACVASPRAQLTRVWCTCLFIF